MNSTKLAALFLVAVLPLAACKGHEGDNVADNTATTTENTATAPTDQTSQSTSGAVTQTTEQEIAGTSNANDLNPVKAQTMIDDVTIGHKVEADDTIAAANQGDDFAPGDPIYRRAGLHQGEGGLVRPGREEDRRPGEVGSDRRQEPLLLPDQDQVLGQGRLPRRDLGG